MRSGKAAAKVVIIVTKKVTSQENAQPKAMAKVGATVGAKAWAKRVTTMGLARGISRARAQEPRAGEGMLDLWWLTLRLAVYRRRTRYWHPDAKRIVA